MGQTVFISLNQITQVHKKDVFLADIGEVYCSDPGQGSFHALGMDKDGFRLSDLLFWSHVCHHDL